MSVKKQMNKLWIIAAAVLAFAGCSKQDDGKVMEQHIELDDTYMNVIKFGNGSRNLAVIAGVSLCGLEGLGPQLENALSVFSKDFTVYVFDRKKVLPEGYTMNQMAEDVYRCLTELGISRVSVYGTSQGGMIGQLLAADHPEMVENLVLCSTACAVDKNLKVFMEWKQAAQNHDVVKLNTLFLDYVYSDSFKESIKDYIPELLKQGTAADCDRFTILLESMEGFDNRAGLRNIKCPVFVIYDKQDKVFPYTAGNEIAKRLGCRHYIYDQYSHAVYDEAPDIKEKIADFCLTPQHPSDEHHP